MKDVEKQIEEVMELVQDLMNAQSSSQRIREKKTLESKLRTLLSSAHSGEQWEYPELPTGSEACEFTSYATVYDADDMRAYVDADRKRRAAGKPNVEMKHD